MGTYTTFNKGTDRSIILIDNDTNAPVDLGGRIIDVEGSPKVTNITSSAIDDTYTRHVQDRDGWSGTITVDRATGALDRLEAEQEARYHANLPQKYYTIQETTRNQADGSVDKFQYRECVIHLQRAGNSRKGSTIQPVIAFEAAEKVEV